VFWLVVLCAVWAVVYVHPEWMREAGPLESLGKQAQWLEPISWLGGAVLAYFLLRRLKYVMEHPFAVAAKTYLKLPKYADHLGQVPVLKEDLKTLLEIRLGHRWWRRRPRRMVVFVDNLDRCGNACICHTLDAIRLVMDLPDVFVVIGVDIRIALQAVAEQYASAAGDGRKAEDIARDYLGKIIQMPILLRRSQPEHLVGFVKDKLFGSMEDVDASDLQSIAGNAQTLKYTSLPEAPETQVEDEDSDRQEPVDDGDGDSGPITPPEPREPELPAESISQVPGRRTMSAQRGDVLQRVMQNSPEEVKWFHFLTVAFGFNNPRQLTRLLNSYELLKALEYQRRDKIDVIAQYALMRVLFFVEFLNDHSSQLRETLRAVLASDNAKVDSKERRSLLEKAGAPADLQDTVENVYWALRRPVSDGRPWKPQDSRKVSPSDELHEYEELVATVMLPGMEEPYKPQPSAEQAKSAGE
jgi:hypothetical protein